VTTGLREEVVGVRDGRSWGGMTGGRVSVGVWILVSTGPRSANSALVLVGHVYLSKGYATRHAARRPEEITRMFGMGAALLARAGTQNQASREPSVLFLLLLGYTYSYIGCFCKLLVMAEKVGRLPGVSSTRVSLESFFFFFFFPSTLTSA